MSLSSRKLWESTSEPGKPFESIARSAIDSKQRAADSMQPIRNGGLLMQAAETSFQLSPARWQLPADKALRRPQSC